MNTDENQRQGVDTQRSSGHKNEDSAPLAELTRRIIGAAMEVSNTLGCGFLEKVYENALVVELRRCGMKVSQQVPIHIVYKNQAVGEYVADLVVEDAVLVETKATEDDNPVFTAKTLNYLKATRLHVGLVVNFGQPRLQWRRLILADTHRRGYLEDIQKDSRDEHR